MESNEHAQLIDEVSTRLGIRNLIDDAYEEQLYDESNGHPYITKVLLGEVAIEGRRVKLERIVATDEAMLDALFDRSFAALSPLAQRIFLTMCGWRSMIPRVGLEAVLLRPGNERLDIGRALSELERSSLIEVVSDTDDGAVFLSVPLAAQIFGRKRLVTSPLKIAIDADLELIRRFGVTTTTDLAQGLGPRIERVIRAAARSASEGEDISQELAVIEYVASEYAPAWLRLAQLESEVGRDAEAIRAVNRYLEVRPDDEKGWLQLIELYRAAEDSLAECMPDCSSPNWGARRSIT
jgi:tetratricopeptide (TPR) repeat protein